MHICTKMDREVYDYRDNQDPFEKKIISRLLKNVRLHSFMKRFSEVAEMCVVNE